MSAAQADDLVGRVLNETYRITRTIGTGGMGDVFEAVHARLAKKRFAIKVLHIEVLSAPDMHARFRREAEIATELGHPNIIDVLDFNQTPDGRPYIVMEYLDGEDLGSRLARECPLPLRDVLWVVEQVGSALAIAHSHGIIHRDMKPENIFLASDGMQGIRIKVLDFGISKIRDSKTIVTRDQTVFGTPHYMSPEQATGSVADIDHTTDIFALGAICYQMVSGALPFDAPSIPGVLYQVCQIDPDPVRVKVPELPATFDAVLRRAMAKQKEDRYQRVEDFVAAVRGCLAPLVGQTPATGEVHHVGLVRPLPDEDLTLPPESMTASPTASGTGPTVAAPAAAYDAAAYDAAAHDAAHDAAAHDAAANYALADDRDDDASRPTAALPQQPHSPHSPVTTLSGAAGQSSADLQPPRRRGLLVAVTIGAVLLLATAAVLLLRSRPKEQRLTIAAARVDPPEATPATATGNDGAAATEATDAPAVAKGTADSTTAATADAGGERAKTVRVALKLTPAKAKVYVDGALRSDNPLLLETSGRPYHLRVEAEGHHRWQRDLVARSDTSLTVRLRAREQRPQRTKRDRTKRDRTRPPKKALTFDDL